MPYDALPVKFRFRCDDPHGRLGILYIRWSDPSQGRGQSLERQKKRGLERAAEHEITIVAIIVDPGKSAFKGVNWSKGEIGKWYAEFMARTTQTEYFFLVEDFDRFSREGPIDGIHRYTGLLKKRLTFLTTSDNKFWSKETGANDLFAVLWPTVVFARAHSESATKQDRSNTSWAVLRKRAIEKRQAQAAPPGWFDVRPDGRFAFNGQEKTLRKIFELTAGRIGRHMIVKMFGDDHVPTFKQARFGIASQWHATTIRYLLYNRAAIGEARIPNPETGRIEVIPDYFVDAETGEPAISRDLWDRAHRALAKTAGGRRGERFANLIQGMTKCDTCRGPLSYQNIRQGYGYLRCDKASRHNGCDNRQTYNTARLESVILDDLIDSGLFVSATDPLDGTTAVITKEIDRLTGERAARQSTVDWYRAETVKDATMRTPGTLREIARLEGEIADLDRKIITKEHDLDVVRGKHPSVDHLAAIRKLRAEAASDDPKIAYISRAAINASLREVIDQIRFCADRTIMIGFGGLSRWLEVDGNTWKIGIEWVDPDKADRQRLAETMVRHGVIPNLDTFTETEKRVPARSKRVKPQDDS